MKEIWKRLKLGAAGVEGRGRDGGTAAEFIHNSEYLNEA